MYIEKYINNISDLYIKENEGKIYKILLQSLERPLFSRLLEYTNGNQIKAAGILGINRNTLRSKIKKLGIQK